MEKDTVSTDLKDFKIIGSKKIQEKMILVDARILFTEIKLILSHAPPERNSGETNGVCEEILRF